MRNRPIEEKLEFTQLFDQYVEYNVNYDRFLYVNIMPKCEIIQLPPRLYIHTYNINAVYISSA